MAERQGDDRLKERNRSTVNSQGRSMSAKTPRGSLRLPPLESLRFFLVAGRHESFAKAARELGVTPAAVAHRIKLLEKRSRSKAV